jgi:hypothetical protein
MQLGLIWKILRAKPTLSEVVTNFCYNLSHSEKYKLEKVVEMPLPVGTFIAEQAEVTALASGESDTMAIWQIESRCDFEILLSAGRTKSWLMVDAHNGGTQLFLGSIVVPEPPKRESGTPL